MWCMDKMNNIINIYFSAMLLLDIIVLFFILIEIIRISQYVTDESGNWQ